MHRVVGGHLEVVQRLPLPRLRALVSAQLHEVPTYVRILEQDEEVREGPVPHRPEVLHGLKALPLPQRELPVTHHLHYHHPEEVLGRVSTQGEPLPVLEEVKRQLLRLYGDQLEKVFSVTG